MPTIRFYEEMGLLPPISRTEAGQRSFDAAAVRRLTFIRRCRDFGFSIDQVRELVGFVDDPHRPCLEVRDIASSRLAEVRTKLAAMHALEASLVGFVVSCDAACAGGAAIDCNILEDLAQPPGGPRTMAGCCSPAKEASR
ncbi:helix-turn-helix domain-containing protein [soil metagenome]